MNKANHYSFHSPVSFEMHLKLSNLDVATKTDS